MAKWQVDFKALDAVTPGIVRSGHKTFATHMYGETDQAHADFLLRHLNPPHDGLIVDMGSGVGEVAARMWCRRMDLNFTLVNLSRVQLDLGPPHGRGFIRVFADATDTGLPANTYDRVMFNTALVQMPQMAALREAARVLRPGGKVMLSECIRYGSNNDEWTQLLQGYVPNIEEFFGSVAHAGLRVEDMRQVNGDDSYFRGLLDEIDKGYLLDTVKPWIIVLGKK